MLLVTGITGHSGKYFLEQLIINDYQNPIRCVVRENSDTSALDNCGLNIQKVVGDLNDPIFISDVMKEVKNVMHIYNIHHSPDIIKYAIKNDVERVILVHTTGIYSKYKSASEEYKNVEAKIDQIRACNQSMMKIVILRPTMIFGDLCDRNISKFIKLIDTFKFFPVIDRGCSYLQPVNARDLGEAYYTVLMEPEKMNSDDYILSGEKQVRMIEMFKIIAKELGKKRYFLNIPLSLGVFMSKILKFLTFCKVDYIERVQRMGEDRSFSHEKAKNDFKYTPMSFEDGLCIEVRQYINRK